MRPARRRQGKSAMRLLEQSVHLLRLAPLDLLPAYYIGSLPFVLGFLYFLSDMSRSADARADAAAGSLAMALLFVWMKTWQALFSRRVLARLGGQPPPSWSLARLGSLSAGQTLLHASGFVILPLALLMTIPLGWCFAFYQNVTVLSDIEGGGIRGLYREAWHQAGLWPYQNHKLLAVVLLFSLVVAVNLTAVVYFLPYAIKTFFGYESVFTLNTFSLFNTTFAATILGLTFLCVDPLVKTIYALRCFDGFSILSGDDIRMQLKGIVSGKQVLTALFVALLLGSTGGLCAEGPAVRAAKAPALPARIRAQDLNRSIEQVLKRPEFSWRLPRASSPQSPTRSSWLADVIKAMGKRLAGAVETVWDWLKRFGSWIRGLFEQDAPKPPKPRAPGSWMHSARKIAALLAALFSALGAFLLWKSRKRRSQEAAPGVAAAAAPLFPDLEDESVRADDLPSERWLALAANLLQQAELRLALRAFFLATLAQLSEQRWITIMDYKSNRDYVGELGRRAGTRTELADKFRLLVARFDAAWYGMHPLNDADIQMYVELQERIAFCAENA